LISRVIIIKKTAKERSRFVKRVVSEVGIYHIRGKPKDICETIEELLK